jgi:hypothetical protein
MAPSPGRNRQLHGRAARLHGAHRIGKGKRSAATCADHSPSEWPAASAGSTPCSASTRAAATLTVMMAGCVFSVRRRVFFRPFETELRKREAERRVGLGKGFGGNGKSLGELAAHANGLRTLPRKEKSNFVDISDEDFIAPGVA